jgi:hypothetical protein
MNKELIRELAEQSTSIVEMVGPQGYASSYTNFDREKFAELIVRECLRQVEEQYKPVLEDEAMMKDTHWDGYVQCGVDSYVAIREHFFGVEE